MTQFDPAAERSFATQVVETLRAAGYQAYWAGGCVRDQLLGRTPKDYDVATSARPDEVRALFGQRRTLALGAAFGVISVLGRKPARPIEVATFRQDAAYSDGRHPDTVTFSTPDQDAKRRDFTINGLFYDPQSKTVIDFVGGQQDLERGLVRAIGDARERFREDKLRLLRAARFAATLGFELETTTRQAAREMAGEIRAVSVERIAAELRLILVHASRRPGVELLSELGLLAAILPELAEAALPDVAGLRSDRWSETLKTLDLLVEPSFPLALAALLCRWVSAEGAGEAGLRLKLSGAETRRAAWLVANCAALEQARETPWPKLQRLLISHGIQELLLLAEAVARATGRDLQQVDYCRRLLALPAAELNPPPLLSGNDLIAHGVPTGPAYQQLLEAVRDAQLEKQIADKPEALRLVDRLRSLVRPSE